MATTNGMQQVLSTCRLISAPQQPSMIRSLVHRARTYWPLGPHPGLAGSYIPGLEGGTSLWLREAEHADALGKGELKGAEVAGGD